MELKLLVRSLSSETMIKFYDADDISPRGYSILAYVDSDTWWYIGGKLWDAIAEGDMVMHPSPLTSRVSFYGVTRQWRRDENI